MDLLEIFEKELVSENLFLDLYAILMLRTTLKKYKELIDNKSYKVDVCLKKNNLEQHIKLHNIIKDFCPLLTRLHLGNNLICPHLYYLYSLKRLLPQCEVLYNK